MPSAELDANPAAAPGSFGVVGYGRMAQALLSPLIESGQLGPAEIRAAVASEASCQRLVTSGLQVSTKAEASWACPVVLLAVKPQQLEAVASNAGGQGGLLISVLAGVRLQRLQELFPQWRCVRAVPNTPALVRSGLTGLAWGAAVEAAERSWVRQLFGQVGEVHELPETQLDAFLALTSSGPAFVALVAEALADGAVAAGLPRVLASHLAHRTLAGSAALLHEQELHPGQLKDMVGSPAGTTMAGIRQLERAGLRSALIEAVLSAAERSRQLG
jgi:pyrroline-5-carboxylate reductase